MGEEIERCAPYGCTEFRSYGGGGNAEASAAVGECVLFLIDGPPIGENMERGGIRPLGCCQGCGLKPVLYPVGVVPVLKKVGVYGRTGTAALFGVVEVGMADEVALPSDAELDGGVSSWPNPRAPAPACEVLMPDRGGIFWVGIAVNWRFCGGGSSNAGRFDAACLRWVRLAGALRASRDVPIGSGTATDARVAIDGGSTRDRYKVKSKRTTAQPQ